VLPTRFAHSCCNIRTHSLTHSLNYIILYIFIVLYSQEKQAKYERKRFHSVTHNTAREANSDFEAEIQKANQSKSRARKHTVHHKGANTVADSHELEIARKVQSDRDKNKRKSPKGGGRNHSLGLGMESMQKAVQKTEDMERDKIIAAQSRIRGRKHTVDHSKATHALHINKINHGYDDDFEESDDEDDENDSSEEDYGEEEEERRAEEEREEEERRAAEVHAEKERIYQEQVSVL